MNNVRIKYQKGIVGNIFWILSSCTQDDNEETVKFNISEKNQQITWHKKSIDFLISTLSGFNLIENANFLTNKKDSAPNWKMLEKGEGSHAGVDLSKEWHLISGHTAFLSATQDAERPAMQTCKKIPIITDPVVAYQFTGYFACHRANGVIILTYYDKLDIKIGEYLIHLKSVPSLSGGQHLKDYQLIQSIFIPAQKTSYITLKIELGQQTDLANNEVAYLFFTHLHLCLAHADAKYRIPYSLGAYQLVIKYNEDWSAWGTAEIPLLKQNKAISIECFNEVSTLGLNDEIEAIEYIKVQAPKIHYPNYALGVVDNFLWVTQCNVTKNYSETITLDNKKLPIHWHKQSSHFIKEGLGGVNLLYNGDFSSDKKKSLKNWKLITNHASIIGVDLNDEWNVCGGYTAFLTALSDEIRPMMQAIQKIPILATGMEYQFFGWFALHRANALIVINYFDDQDDKIGEHIINVHFSKEYSGGKALKNYQHIESIFIPDDETRYLTLTIKLDEQIDFSEPGAYLFCAYLHLGIFNEEPAHFIRSFSQVESLIAIIKEEKDIVFGAVKLPILKTGDYLVAYANKTHKLDLLENTNHKQTNYQEKIQLYIDSQGLDTLISRQQFSINTLQALNKDCDITSLFEVIKCISKQRVFYLFSKPKNNAEFYTQLGLHHQQQGAVDRAIKSFSLALYFFPMAITHEYLADIASTSNKKILAISHYQQAIALESPSDLVYYHLSKLLIKQQQYGLAINTMLLSIQAFPEISLHNKTDEIIQLYWQENLQYFDYLAKINARDKLIIETTAVVKVIASAYRKYFSVLSGNLAPSIIKKCKKVLIIADTYLPQCVRYRIKQKIEQFSYIDVKAKSISWTASKQATQEIPWYDQIIFYRVPAFPEIIKLVEYAKSLGKLTYYEIDDLIFQPIYPSDIRSYGGAIDLEQYFDLVKGMASFRAAAQLCDYAIASTRPLLENLTPLVIKQQGYLHRNALDSTYILGESVSGDMVTIFYGTGTLAHNSDFIDIILPAIERLLLQFSYVRMVIHGYLTLPPRFIRKYKKQVVTVPFSKDVQQYYDFLKSADINISILKQDDINDCKSEIKWIEAAFYKIPSVVSGTKNYIDVINDKKDGFIVYSTDEWYRVIGELIKDSKLRKKIGYAAYLRVNKEYSLPKMSQNLKDIFLVNKD